MPSLYTSVDFVDRLRHCAERRDRRIVFLVGSALCLPDHPGTQGVPGPSDIVELIRAEFDGQPALADLSGQLEGPLSVQYQRAFEFLNGRRGQDAVNRVVRTAVARSLDQRKWPPHLPPEPIDVLSQPTCTALEREPSAWTLPRGIQALTRLVSEYSDAFGECILTTNFDPLIEVGLRHNSRRYYRTVLHADGNLTQTVGDGTHVVHLHGYWHGYDTLHTPQQLQHERPQLRHSLSNLIEQSTLVVIGYGGWDDILIRTLTEIMEDGESNAEIMWAFHKTDASQIQKDYASLIDMLGPGIARGRTALYSGIDCRVVLNNLDELLKSSYRPGAATRQASTSVKEMRTTDGLEGGLRIEINFPQQPKRLIGPDSPLVVEPWIGRNEELRLLSETDKPVAVLTGLGGQGKSALASRFVQTQGLSREKYEHWDWRDCREESDRLLTQLLRAIEFASNGAVQAHSIESTSIKAVVSVLFSVLENRRALIVFDNVDQYVDLESRAPVKGLDVLISEATTRRHRSLLLFTCRPDLAVDESRVLRLALGGLSVEETSELLSAKGVPRVDLRHAEELHSRTKGHPLWINLLVMQGLRQAGGLRSALDTVKSGSTTLPETTKTIWSMLNAHQRSVLRTMAELDRPETQQRLTELVTGLNTNRIIRALKALHSFHMIETRTQEAGPPLLDLHPIIRQFVRSEFPRQDREKYVGSILNFFDRFISRFKDLLPSEPAYDILEHWIKKADIQVGFSPLQAIDTIAEIASPLINRGYQEEYVRICRRIFAAVAWAEACSSHKEFDGVFTKCITLMIQLGLADEVAALLQRYEQAIPGKSAQFINLCDLRCYAAWFEKDFASAIHWGLEGQRLKSGSSVDTSFSAEHNLSLALRDGGRLDDALKIMVGSEALNAVVTPGHLVADKTAVFYGNIGRCLFLKSDLQGASICYVKSAQLLQDGRDHVDSVNRGYVRLWFAELFEKQGNLDLAAVAFRSAECMWHESSPPRAEATHRELQRLAHIDKELERYLDMPDWRIEAEFVGWLERQR